MLGLRELRLMPTVRNTTLTGPDKSVPHTRHCDERLEVAGRFIGGTGINYNTVNVITNTNGAKMIKLCKYGSTETVRYRDLTQNGNDTLPAMIAKVKQVETAASIR